MQQSFSDPAPTRFSFVSLIWTSDEQSLPYRIREGLPTIRPECAALIPSSAKRFFPLSSCAEHARSLFCKFGKHLGQNAVGSTVAVLAGRLFHGFRRRILTRLGQSEARPNRTHRFLGFHGWRDRCCVRFLLLAGS